MSDFTVHLSAAQAQALLEVVGQILSKGADKAPEAEKKAKGDAKAKPKERSSLRTRMVVKGVASKEAAKVIRKRKVPTTTDKVLHEIGSDTNAVLIA